MAGLGDDRHLLPGQPLLPGLEHVEVGVRSEDPHRPRGQLPQLPFGGEPFRGTDFRKAGREHDGDSNALLDAFLEDGNRLAHQHDGEVKVEWNVGDATVGRRAQDLRLRGMHRHDGGATRAETVTDLDPLVALLGTFRLRGAHDRNRLAGALQKRGGQRRLGDEGEGSVLIDRDLGQDHVAHQVRGALVEGLDELHDVDAVLAEGGTHGWRGGRPGGGRLDLEDCADFLCHSVRPPRC